MTATRYPGGYITDNPTLPTVVSAPGVWRLKDVFQNIKNLRWPGTGALIDYLVVAGGGQGAFAVLGSLGVGGGGGAGGLKSDSMVLTKGAYAITVGSGGISGGANATDSSIAALVVAHAGGTGGAGGTSGAGQPGGSGGGGGNGSVPSVGGAGTVGEGHDGGAGGPGNAGGGGGAGGAGVGGAGGPGLASSISGTSVVYAGGGFSGVSTPGSGGAGSVGNGSGDPGHAGIVIIRYLTGSASATGGTITTSGPYTIHTFTANGTFTLS